MYRMRVALLAVFFLCSFNLPLLAAREEFLSVQVKQGQLRSSPTFLGAVTAVLSYGDKVKLIEDKGAWKKVTLHKNTGWMHMSALTTKTIAVQAGKSNVKTGASSSELSLAGKGFNAKVEAEFKSRNKNIDFTQVDRMETVAIKPVQMQAFLKKGQVEPPEEAAR